MDAGKLRPCFPDWLHLLCNNITDVVNGERVMAADSVLEEVHSLQTDVAQELKNEEQLVEQLFLHFRQNRQESCEEDE